jgi:hypothetical protein
MGMIGLIENLPGINEIRGEDIEKLPVDVVFRAAGGNTGNIAYVAGAHSLIADQMQIIDWSTPDETITERCDSIVVCCANQIGAHADLGGWAQKLAAVGLPVTLLGLGAQADSQADSVAVPEGTRKFLDVVKGLRWNPEFTNISVRGDYTKAVLSSLGHESEATGCPSLFINPDPELGRKVALLSGNEQARPVAISAGNPYVAKAVAAEIHLAAAARRGNWPYLIQHPSKMLQLALSGRSEMVISDVEFILSKIAPDCAVQEFLDWCARYWRVYLDHEKWMASLRECSFVIGARYHGVALGIQAGVPGCVVTIDARTEELSTFSCIPTVGLDEIVKENDIKALRSACNPAWGLHFDDNRAQLSKRWSEFLLRQNLKPAASLIAVDSSI